MEGFAKILEALKSAPSYLVIGAIGVGLLFLGTSRKEWNKVSVKDRKRRNKAGFIVLTFAGLLVIFEIIERYFL